MNIVGICCEKALVLSFALGLPSLAFAIWGAILRFGEAGATCSGDFYDGYGKPEPYLWDQGIFMKWYLIYMLVVWALCLCMTCCILTCLGVVAVAKKNEDFERV